MDVYLTPKFQAEFAGYPADQQDLVIDFVDIVEEHGLSDLSKLVGKLSPSWKTDDPVKYEYAKTNGLWHYHIGLPEYKDSQVTTKYKVSEWVLHFQWLRHTHPDEIWLVDMYSHYLKDGSFYLPSATYLKD